MLFIYISFSLLFHFFFYVFWIFFFLYGVALGVLVMVPFLVSPCLGGRRYIGYDGD
jgi:hypothetical protein